MTFLRELAYLTAIFVGGLGYFVADSLNPDHLARMDRHLDAYQRALIAGHPSVGGPVLSLAAVEPFEMYPDPDEDD
jgi:hypothetical protein